MERLAAAFLLTLACLLVAACPGGRTPPAAHRPLAPVSPASRATPQAVPADRQQLENIIRNIVAEVLSVSPDEVDAGAPLVKQKVAADELDAIEIVMNIEEKFGVEIADEDVAGPDGGLRADLSVKTLAEMVAAKAARK